jgi:RimJ/RimL family protein N-acetyltransferase
MPKQTPSLRELSRADLPTITRWRNDPALIAQLGAPFRYINRETDEAWFEVYLQNRHTEVRCVIEDAGTAIGLISLTGIHPVHRTAELHILIGEPEARGKGHGRAAMDLMLRHAFYDLDLRRVWLAVVATNARAEEFYRRLGFQIEGLLREAIYKQGHPHGLVLMGLLKHEFAASREGQL